MAEQPKELRTRIRSVNSTRKITKTMELVATSKMKRAQDRVNAALPYTSKLSELLGEVIGSGVQTSQPLLEQRQDVRNILVFLITANRGLCGGYNANVIRHVKQFIQDQKEQKREVILDVLGKKGIGTLNYQGYSIRHTHTDLGDRPGYQDALRYIEPLRDDFLKGKCDEVYIAHTQWLSAASQKPRMLRVLPIEGEKRTGVTRDFIFEPSPEELLAALLPTYLTQTMYTALVESLASEHVARRTAMKSATDNADEMITHLTRNLNRARQAQITQEIAEIVGGVAALEK